MLSFHNDEAVKAKYQARLAAHAAADELIHGTYWEEGKGCAVGCTIHSDDHSAYETELGLPMWLAFLEDRLFEGLSNGRAKNFAVQFLGAIPVGVDLAPVRHQFCAYLMRENLARVRQLQIANELKAQVLDAIGAVLELYDKAGDDPQARSAAWSATWSAARSAASAVWSAVWSAARSAASAAESAAWSAACAARSAASAAESAESAAWSAAYERYADKLLELLRDAK